MKRVNKIINNDNTVSSETKTADGVFDGFPGNAGERFTLTNVTITQFDNYGYAIMATTNGNLKIKLPEWLVDGFYTNNVVTEMTFNVHHIHFSDLLLSAVEYTGLTTEQQATIDNLNSVTPDHNWKAGAEGLNHLPMSKAPLGA